MIQKMIHKKEKEKRIETPFVYWNGLKYFMTQKNWIIANFFFLSIVFGQESFRVQYALEPGTCSSYYIEQQDSLLSEDQRPSFLFSRMLYTVRIDTKSFKKLSVTFSLDSLWTFSQEAIGIVEEEKKWKNRFQPPLFSSEVTNTGQFFAKNAPFYFFWIPFPDTLLTLYQIWPFHFSFQIKKPYHIAEKWNGTIQAVECLGDSVAVFHFNFTQSEEGKTIIPEPFRKIIMTYEGKTRGTGMVYFYLKKRKIEKVVAELHGEVHIKKEKIDQTYSKITRIFVKLLE